MKPENAIEVHDIKKRFKVYFDKGSSLKEKLIFKKRNRYEERWVLKGVSFEVKKGEAIGLIGKNGCGKSTTLKMLTRIMYPTKGSIEIQGRVSSLIELGAGFHPDMSGRENIFTNASIFGLTHAEIERRLDDIIKFSELEEFIDNPVRTYSSGMYMRLAFAVAINVDADVLLIDEILAVGDVSFQTKCFEKLKEIKAKGTTIVLVTHVMGQIEKICDRAIWIEEGLIREEGTPKEVGKHYLEVMEERRMAKLESDYKKEREEIKKAVQEEKSKSETEKKETNEDKNAKKMRELPMFCKSGAEREGNRKVEFIDGCTLNKQGEEKIIFASEEPIILQMKYKTNKKVDDIRFSVNFTRDDGIHCFGTGSLSGIENPELCSAKDQGELKFIIEENHLQEGRYLIDIAVQGKDGEVYDYIYNAMEIRIHNDENHHVGIVNMPVYWEVDGKELRRKKN